MKSKKRLALICIVIIVIVIVGLGIGYFIINDRDKQKEASIKKVLEQELRLSDKSVEYGTEINLLDKNGIPDTVFQNVSYDNEILEKQYVIYAEDDAVTSYKFEKLGEVEFTEVNYAYYKTFFNQIKKVEVKNISTYTVEDTKKPILEGISDKSITVGDNIDLKEGITARDEVDGNLEITIEGNVDTNAVGEYNVKVIAKDKHDNVTEDTYIVKVNSKAEVKKEETNKTTNKASSSSKSSVKTNVTNNSQGISGNEEKEQSTYTYETYGDKIYFEEDRGTNGNYSEKFTW